MSYSGEVAVLPDAHGRSVPRRLVNFTAYMREAGARISPIEILDLSADGCRFRTDLLLETATEAWVRISGLGAKRVRIIWSTGGEFGCEFSSPLDEAVVMQLASVRASETRGRLQRHFCHPKAPAVDNEFGSHAHTRF